MSVLDTDIYKRELNRHAMRSLLKKLRTPLPCDLHNRSLYYFREIGRLDARHRCKKFRGKTRP